MAEIRLNANAARPYDACAMPVRHFAATSCREARTYGCRASPLLTPPHAAVMQICCREKMSAHRVDLFALAKCRAGASTRRSVRTEMSESFRTPSDAGAPRRCSLPPSLPQDHCSAWAPALCERSLQPPINTSNVFAKTGRERRRGEGLPALSKRALFSLVIYFS